MFVSIINKYTTNVIQYVLHIQTHSIGTYEDKYVHTIIIIIHTYNVSTATNYYTNLLD